jgi:hypothetical protein
MAICQVERYKGRVWLGDNGLKWLAGDATAQQLFSDCNCLQKYWYGEMVLLLKTSEKETDVR